MAVANVESSAVAGTLDLATDQWAFAERAVVVGAAVLEGVKLAVHTDHADSLPKDAHDAHHPVLE